MNNFKEQVLRAIDALEKQGTHAIHEGSCTHLDETNGNCCIVGHMMPSNELRRKAEQQTVTNIEYLYAGKFDPWIEQFTQDQIYVLGRLQDLHDEPSLELTEAILEMRKIANEL